MSRRNLPLEAKATGPVARDSRREALTVTELLGAGGLSAFPSTPHKVTASQGVIPGVYTAKCSCGWQGRTYGSKGARSAAVSEKYMHLDQVEHG